MDNNFILNKKDLKIFKFKGIDYNKKYTFEELKNELLKDKFVSMKNKQIINKYSLEELKDFIYTGIIEEKPFEGIAPIFTAVCKKDFPMLASNIIKGNLNPMNILRLMFFCLENSFLYEDNKLGYYINIFKIKYENKFRRSLFILGELNFIDKLDLLNFLKELMY